LPIRAARPQSSRTWRKPPSPAGYDCRGTPASVTMRPLSFLASAEPPPTWRGEVMKRSGAAPCQCHSREGVIVSPGVNIDDLLAATWHSPTPSVTCTVCPTASHARHCVRRPRTGPDADGIRDGPPPRAMTSKPGVARECLRPEPSPSLLLEDPASLSFGTSTLQCPRTSLSGREVCRRPVSVCASNAATRALSTVRVFRSASDPRIMRRSGLSVQRSK